MYVCAPSGANIRRQITSPSVPNSLHRVTASVMSRNFPGGQVEHGFNPKRLQNWEVPAVEKNQAVTADTRFSTLTARTGKTEFIADDRGHVLPGVPKIDNSFTKTIEVVQRSPPRWPKATPTIPGYPNATMGYKGIQTDYLPTNTVHLNASEVPGLKETNYNFK